MKNVFKNKLFSVVRRCSICLIVLGLVAIIGLNLMYNLTGHWAMPSVLPGAFERVKSLIYVDAETLLSGDKILNRTLVNVHEGLKKWTKTTNMYTTSNKSYDILWYNKPVWIDLHRANTMLATECTYSNCHMSDRPTDIQHYAAIIYCMTSPLGHSPPIAKDERNPDQAWVYFGLESSINHKYLSYRHKNWRNTMNWSMSYEFDADIFFPYGMLEPRAKELNKDYNSVFSRKTKFAAWFVSNCGAHSKRDDYVSELKHHGVDIDISGRCANGIFQERHDLETSLDNYKFYFSFENSLCKDYITEKFFKNYNLDVVLVVRGGGDYDRVLPNGAFINSAHFESTEDLAKYVIKVGSSVELFTSFLKRKDQYIATDMFHMPTSYCVLCHKLNNIEENRKSYIDHVTNIHYNKCWKPSDVELNQTAYVLIAAILLIPFLSLLTFVYLRRTNLYNTYCKCL